MTTMCQRCKRNVFRCQFWWKQFLVPKNPNDILKTIRNMGQTKISSYILSGFSLWSRSIFGNCLKLVAINFITIILVIFSGAILLAARPLRSVFDFTKCIMLCIVCALWNGASFGSVIPIILFYKNIYLKCNHIIIFDQ